MFLTCFIFSAVYLCIFPVVCVWVWIELEFENCATCCFIREDIISDRVIMAPSFRSVSKSKLRVTK